MRAWIDLMALYQQDNTVLDNLTIPVDEENNPIVDVSTLKDNLILDTAELEVLYPDPEFLKSAIGIWSAKRASVWLEIWKTTQYEYNPIWNKDGTIDETITRNLSGSSNKTEDFTRTDNLTNTQDITRTDDLTTTNNLAGTVDTTIDSSVYGYNSSTAAPSDKSVEDTDTTNTGTVTNTGTQRNAGTVTNTGTVRNAGSATEGTTDTGTITTSRTEQGNIGVTSTQQLIKEQREVVELSVIDYIINDFKQRFCLLLY